MVNISKKKIQQGKVVYYHHIEIILQQKYCLIRLFQQFILF